MHVRRDASGRLAPEERMMSEEMRKLVAKLKEASRFLKDEVVEPERTAEALAGSIDQLIAWVEGRLATFAAPAAGDRGNAEPVEPAAQVAIPMLLWCPGVVVRDGAVSICGVRHVDRGAFATKLHHTHSCQTCGHTWRPAVVATVGVEFLPGFRDAKPESAEGARVLPERCACLGCVACGSFPGSVPRCRRWRVKWAGALTCKECAIVELTAVRDSFAATRGSSHEERVTSEQYGRGCQGPCSCSGCDACARNPLTGDFNPVPCSRVLPLKRGMCFECFQARPGAVASDSPLAAQELAGCVAPHVARGPRAGVREPGGVRGEPSREAEPSVNEWTFCTEHRKAVDSGSCGECDGDRNLIQVVRRY